MVSPRFSQRVSWILALLVCAAFLGIELGDYFLRGVKDVESIGSKPTVVREFGEGAPIAQSFSIARDGLHSVSVSISSDEPVVIELALDLVRSGLTPGSPQEGVATRVVEISKPSGVTWHTIDFPPISPSKGRTFTARFQLKRAEPHPLPPGGQSAARPAVGLMAWKDNPLPTGALSVGDQDRWGDLAFAAQANPPSRLQRMVDALSASLPAALRLNLGVAVLFAVLYGLLVLTIAIIAIAQLLPAIQHLAAQTEPHVQARRTRGVRALSAVALALAAPALFVAILAARERVAVDLVKDLDLAVLESPAGMHGAFSPWQEAINGNAPPAIFAHPPSRIIWTVTVPAHKPTLKASAALRPYVWEQRSDGVLFKISAEEGGTVRTLSSRFVNPGENLNDRGWVNMDVDLSEYAGRSVKLALTTSAGPAGNPAWDWAMWGDPRIIERR